MSKNNNLLTGYIKLSIDNNQTDHCVDYTMDPDLDSGYNNVIDPDLDLDLGPDHVSVINANPGLDSGPDHVSIINAGSAIDHATEFKNPYHHPKTGRFDEGPFSGRERDQKNRSRSKQQKAGFLKAQQARLEKSKTENKAAAKKKVTLTHIAIGLGVTATGVGIAYGARAVVIKASVKAGTKAAPELAEQFGTKQVLPYASSVKGVHGKTITGYQQGAGGKWNAEIVNASLRDEKIIGTKLVPVVQHLDDVMLHAPATEKTMVVYRGFGLSKTNPLHDDIIASVVKKDATILPGKIITDKGFASTSLDPGTAVIFSERSALTKTFLDPRDIPVTMDVTIPSGTKGVYLSGKMNIFDEKEFLLPRGSRIEIISAQIIMRPGRTGPSQIERVVLKTKLVGFEPNKISGANFFRKPIKFGKPIPVAPIIDITTVSSVPILSAIGSVTMQGGIVYTGITAVRISKQRKSVKLPSSKTDANVARLKNEKYKVIERVERDSMDDARIVRTPEGAAKFGVAIGSKIPEDKE